VYKSLLAVAGFIRIFFQHDAPDKSTGERKIRVEWTPHIPELDEGLGGIAEDGDERNAPGQSSRRAGWYLR
jgi:hypothetical protein